jgi:hypothetical protein
MLISPSFISSYDVSNVFFRRPNKSEYFIFYDYKLKYLYSNNLVSNPGPGLRAQITCIMAHARAEPNTRVTHDLPWVRIQIRPPPTKGAIRDDINMY